MGLFRTGRRGLLLLVIATGLLAAAGGVAYATGGQSNVVYTACKLNATGAVRLIDPALSGTSLLSHCNVNETQVAWNQQGPPGVAGANGVDGAPCLPTNPACVGPKGDKGDPGTNGTDGASPLWVVIDGASGTALRGSGFAGADHAPSAGVYRIIWGASLSTRRDISSCGYAATLINVNVGNPGDPGGEIAVTPGTQGRLFVSTYTDAGAPVDHTFSVAVFC